MSMKTATVKCYAMTSSRNALVINDSLGKQAYIPFQYLLNKRYHETTNELCEITIPLWLAIDRGVSYEQR